MTDYAIDLFEYASNDAANVLRLGRTPAFVFPVDYTDAIVKATTKYDTNTWAYLAANPLKLLTGNQSTNGWQSNAATNQRFHIDLGSARIVTRVYYENGHDSATNLTRGAKNFTLWGSNDAGAFAELTYGTNTNWTQLTTNISQLAQHAFQNASDVRYIEVANTVAYRYYAFKFADNWGDASYIAVRRIVMMALPATAGAGPDDTYTKSLLHFEGSDGALEFTDECGRYWRPGGDARIKTDQSKFGGSSLYCDGTGDYLIGDANSDFVFGTADFTIDFWAWAADWTLADKVWVDFRTVQGLFPCIYTGTYLKYWNNSAERITGTTAMVNGTWNHIALVRSSGVTRLYLNGSQQGSDYTDTSDYSVGASRPALMANGTAAVYTAGYIDELRISKGVARWTSSFTPPSSPYPGIEISSESSIINEGSYSLKMVAKSATIRDGVAGVVYPTFTRLYSSSLDLSSCKFIKFDLRSNRTGSNIKIVLNGGVAWEFTPNVSQANTFQSFAFDFFGMAKMKRIWSFQIVAINTDADNTFYLDNFRGSSGTDLTIDRAEKYPKNIDARQAWHGNPDLEIDEFTRCLMHFDGANGSTVFTEETGKPVTVTADAKISTTQSKFGGASGYFDGTGDTIDLDSSLDFVFGASDFTIEFWVWMSDFNVTKVFTDWRQASFVATYPMVGVASGKAVFYSNNDLRITGHTTLSNSQWHHIALSKASNYARLFVDGVLQGLPWSDTQSYAVGSARPRLMASGVDGAGTNGYIDEFRVSKGVGRYTQSFIPQTKPFYSTPLVKSESGINGPDDSYTKLLMHFDGKHGDAFYTAETGQPVRFRSTAMLSSERRGKFGATSLRFADTGTDHLELADSDDWYFGTGDFCIDFWINWSLLPASYYVKYFWNQNIDDGTYIYFRLNNDAGTLKLEFVARNTYTYTVQMVRTAPATALFKWYHMAVTRSGNDFRIFQNGVQVGTTYTSSGAIPNLGCPAWIGRGIDGTMYLGAHLGEFRISKGHARWTADFTPPTAPYQAPVIKDEGNSSLKIMAGANAVDENISRNLIIEGGDITTSGGKTIHTFKESDYFRIPPGISIDADLLVVGGGGGGGGRTGGGGGAGGFRTLRTVLTPGIYPVRIGAGGQGAAGGAQGAPGSESSFGSLLTSAGGGGGGTNGGSGGAGGSGGGTGHPGGTAGAGVAGQGHNGGSSTYNNAPWSASGGGGADKAGGAGDATYGGVGGDGLQSSISGTAVWYAGGGGGGQLSAANDGLGGLGGGGAAGGQGGNPMSGIPNTGGGGGGQVDNLTTQAGNGGSGIVIVSYTTIDLKLDLANRSNVTFKARANRTGENVRLSLPVCSGGKKFFSGSKAILVFTQGGVFYPPLAGEVDYLIVGGGGGGGAAHGGGGGAGGVRTGTGFSVTAQPYTITVGKGGLGGTAQENQKGVSGGDSSFGGMTAVGGGGGGCYISGDAQKNGINGGSGGGSSGSATAGTPGTGTTDQGYSGGVGSYNGTAGGGGGGGGASAAGANGSGNNGGKGGDGVSSSIMGAARYYGGGGGGGAWSSNTGGGASGAGGLGGGGDGGLSTSNTAGRNATPNTGGGGGGGNDYRPGGGKGADGIVIISYEIDDLENAYLGADIETIDTWQLFSMDISQIDADFLGSLNSVDIQILDASSDNIFYLDEVLGLATVYVFLGLIPLKTSVYPIKIKNIFSYNRLKTLQLTGKRTRLTFNGRRPDMTFSGKRPKARFTGWRTD